MPLQLSCRPFIRRSRGFVASGLLFAITGIAACFAPSNAAFAQIARTTTDGTPQIDASIANKDWNAALQQLDARLQSNPRDVQAKFKRATVLARLNRDDEAIAAFTELTQAYPELPEPYNNLAALYAKKGRYEDARAALETAVKANPGYALAYDNLGDLYLRLASESYKRAQSLGSTSPLTRQRVTDIQKIIAPPPVSRRAAAASATAVASPPRAASDLWAPTRGSMPSPDTYSPYGGPSSPLQQYTTPAQP
jgi:tetratricopeptide (TPR) repeat protein